MSDISKNVLEQIKEEKIKPKPRWEFLVKNNIFWAVFAIFVALGGVAVSVMIFMLTDQDWDIYDKLGKSFTEYLLLSVPYFWLLLVMAFLAFAWIDLKHTKSGYKYSFFRIGILNIVSSLVLGVIFFYSGLGLKMDKAFAENIPFYQTMHPLRPANVWENPERGFLVGEIISFVGDDNFNLVDPLDNEWLIECVNCVWRSGAEAREGMVVKIFGQKVDNHNFQAFEMRIGRPGLVPKRQPSQPFRSAPGGPNGMMNGLVK